MSGINRHAEEGRVGEQTVQRERVAVEARSDGWPVDADARLEPVRQGKDRIRARRCGGRVGDRPHRGALDRRQIAREDEDRSPRRIERRANACDGAETGPVVGNHARESRRNMGVALTNRPWLASEDAP